jgi:HK97 family phage portal protein
MNIFTRVSKRSRSKDLAQLHPEVSTRQHLLSIQSDAQILAPYTYLDALVTHESHVWVRKAVAVIADNAAPLPLLVLRNKTDLIENHPALELLATPNKEQSHADLWKQWCVDMLLGGEEGWEITLSRSGKPREIWPRQPHVFGVIPDPASQRYFGVKGYQIDDKAGDPYNLPPAEFAHYKFFNPRNPWRGLSVMLAIRMSVLIDVFAQAWQRFFFANSARPDYAVVTPQGTTQTERDMIEQKINQKYGGVSNAGKVIALEEGIADIKVLSFKPSDLGALELRQFSRDEIGGVFGVPDILMGFGTDAYDTEIKRTAAIQALYTLTIKPLLGFRDDRLTKTFRMLRVLADNEELITSYDDVSELGEAQDSEWARVREQLDRGAMTINEWRTMQGLTALPWGGVAWLPANLLPVSGAASMTPAANQPAPAVQGQSLLMPFNQFQLPDPKAAPPDSFQLMAKAYAAFFTALANKSDFVDRSDEGA